MRFEMGEGCVALRSLCAVRVRVRQRWVPLGGRVAGSSFLKAHYINSLNSSILWTASSLLSRVLLRPGARGRSKEFSGTAVAVCSEFACVRWVLGKVAAVVLSKAHYNLSASILWTASFLLSRVLPRGGRNIEFSY